MERTTDLSELKRGEPFTWGEVIAIDEIAEYAIVTYHPWKQEECTLLEGQPNKSETSYHCYVNNRNCSRSTDSFDAALALCIAYKHEGANQQASSYFMRMLKGE